VSSPESRVAGAIGRSIWDAYDAYQARVAREREQRSTASSVPDGTDERPGACDA
jgi:hypothetical protein